MTLPPHDPYRAVPRRTREPGRLIALASWVVPLVLLLVFLGGSAVGHPGGLAGAVGDLLHARPRLPSGATPPVHLRDRPSPGVGETGAPLGVPPQPADPAAPHAFARTRADDGGATVPVTWSACRPIHYVVDTTFAPPDFPAWVDLAVAEVAAATGLRFVGEGVSTEPRTGVREPFQPDRYGDRWAPALIRFATPEENPALAGLVAGTGGAVAVVDPQTGIEHWVTGAVDLDVELLGQPDVVGEPAYVRVLRHELGHVVGLAHVDDVGQLMHASTGTASRFQAGDLAGLAALGAGPCAPGL